MKTVILSFRLIYLIAASSQVALTIATTQTTSSRCDQCSQYADCKNDTNGIICDCHAGYKGLKCTEDVDECALSPTLCNHRGPCYNTFGSWRCDCLTGWYGDHCEVKNNSSGVWLCMPGWMGDECFDQCLPNNSSNCGPTQICTHTYRYRGRYYNTCSCKDGWTGPNCIDVDECLSNPCTSPKTNCVNSPGSFMCHCPSGWQGDMCNNDVDECASNTCQHAKSCANTVGSFNCTCLEGWEGVQCSEDVNECQTKPCELSKECVNTMGSFKCQVRNELGYPDVPTYFLNPKIFLFTILISIIIIGTVVVVLLVKGKRPKTKPKQKVRGHN